MSTSSNCICPCWQCLPFKNNCIQFRWPLLSWFNPTASSLLTGLTKLPLLAAKRKVSHDIIFSCNRNDLEFSLVPMIYPRLFFLNFFPCFSWYMNIQIILAENLETSTFVGSCLQPLNLCAFFQPEPCGEVLSMLSIPLKSISERFMSTFEDWVKPFKTWKSQSIDRFQSCFQYFFLHQISPSLFWGHHSTMTFWESGMWSPLSHVHSRGVSPGHLCSWSSWYTFWKAKSIERIVKDNFEHNHLIEKLPKHT